jgi:cell shape-determining protein MreC
MMPVAVAETILVGQISQVFKNYSLARTIFSPDWEIPVRIGEKKIPALLIGGPNLKLTMIVNDQRIFDGQPVFVSSQDFPYGMKIGETVNVKSDSATGVFQEAGVKIDYDLGGLTQLTILLWTAD